MAKINVKIFRDVAKNPNVVEITRRGRKITATYDGDNLTLEGPQGELPSISEVLQMAYPYELEPSPKPEWYDRNPKTTTLFINYVAEGPHAETLRNSYNCPSSRMAIFQSLQCSLVRASAAAPIGTQTYITAYFIPHYDPLASLQVWKLDLGTANVAGDRADLALNSCAVLLPGDAIDFYTGDDSTGGTVNYVIGVLITEFDA